MTCYGSVTFCGDPGDGVFDGFIRHRHAVGIGMDQRFGVGDQRDVTFPEQQVVALIGGGGLITESHLLIAITGAGDATGK